MNYVNQLWDNGKVFFSSTATNKGLSNVVEDQRLGKVLPRRFFTNYFDLYRHAIKPAF